METKEEVEDTFNRLIRLNKELRKERDKSLTPIIQYWIDTYEYILKDYTCTEGKKLYVKYRLLGY